MTKEQYKLCGIICRYKQLDKVLRRAKLESYLELNYAFPPLTISYSDADISDSCTVIIDDGFLEEYAQMRKQRRKEVSDAVFTAIGVVGSLVGILSFFSLK